MREAHSRANLSIASRRPLLEMVEVCFLAMGKPTQVDYAVSIIRNIEAHAANDVRYHMLVDKPPAPLEAQMRARAVWRGLPMERIRLQSVVDISGSARAMYTALRATATGPGGLYLYKPLLHLVLPRTVPRVIVLDTDLFVFASLRGLWDLFGRFDTPQLIGLAQARPPHIRPPMPPTHPPVRRRMPAASCVCTQHRPRGAGTWQEQCPSYQEVRALGGRGFNGGVQLLALDKMRASPHYGQLLWKHARRQLPMKPGGIGWLGALHGTTRHSRPDTHRHLPQHIASLATAVALAALSSLATPSRLAARVLFAPRGDPPPLCGWVRQATRRFYSPWLYLLCTGDQTLYSWMSVNGSGAEDLFFELPCGWNRQIGTHMAGWRGFWRSNRCSEPCQLLHGNYVNHKKILEALKQDPTGASCRAVVRRFRKTDTLFRDGTADARMIDMVGAKCCARAFSGGGATATSMAAAGAAALR